MLELIFPVSLINSQNIIWNIKSLVMIAAYYTEYGTRISLRIIRTNISSLHGVRIG